MQATPGGLACVLVQQLLLSRRNKHIRNRLYWLPFEYDVTMKLKYAATMLLLAGGAGTASASSVSRMSNPFFV
jgi:hypothetical protein